MGRGLAGSLGSVVGAVLDAALPGSCAGCGREGDVLCAVCLPALRSGLDRPGGVALGLPADLPAPLVQLEWCGPFDGPVRGALHGLKYCGERRLAEPLGQAVADRWRVVGRGGDLLVPVPVHAERRRERGFDQAELISRVAGRHLRMPSAPLLVRDRATIAQFHLARRDRATNVAGAFRVRPDVPPDALDGRWIVLVDDVVTTGATLIGCAQALLEAGARAVSAVTVARED